jgi:hypothetical protein
LPTCFSGRPVSSMDPVPIALAVSSAMAACARPTDLIPFVLFSRESNDLEDHARGLVFELGVLLGDKLVEALLG